MGKNKDITAESGFTLVELMIASAVFLIGILGALNAFVGSNSLRISAEERTNVQTHISTVMDEIYRIDDEAVDPFNLHSYEPATHDGFPFITTVVQYVQDDGTRVTPPLDPDLELPNPLEVYLTTTVTYSSGRQRVLVTNSIVRR